MWRPSSPKFGSCRCHFCTAQYEPSGALQTTLTHWIVGPSYFWQWFLNVFQTSFRYVPQPPE
jgi:hypothetical protein